MSSTNDARFWDSTAQKYAASHIADQAGYERSLAAIRTRLKPGDRVLELGCGTGSTALRLADAVRDYVATDISPAMITIAADKLTTQPVPGLSFHVAVAEDLLASDSGQFDVVLGLNYLHLLRDMQDTLRIIHALLKPGGMFISKTVCLSDMNPLIRRVMLPVMQAFGKAPHVDCFRHHELARRIEGAGFRIETSEFHASKPREARPYIVTRRA